MKVRAVHIIDGPESALAAMEAHVFRAADELRRLKIPRLYDAGVHYSRPAHEYQWRTPSQVIAQGFGHCPDFAAWRVAELRKSGQDPGATVYVRDGGRAGLWHVLVRRGDGTTEDPSVILGMRNRNRRLRR